MRRRILDAALRVFAERGFHGTAVPLVAEAAQVGTGTLYRYFQSKEQLVNEVFRDAKGRLKDAIFTDFDVARPPSELFTDVWRRLVSFARREPLAFQFLEMQDHVPYLDRESRNAELAVLAPIWMLSTKLTHAGAQKDLPAEVAIAMVWGALVGVLKAERLGYLKLTDQALEQAGAACWAATAIARGEPVELGSNRASPITSSSPSKRQHAPSRRRKQKG